MKNFTIKISGPAGTGIMQAGETFSKTLNKLGFFTLVYPEYPSRIRGGDNNVQIVFSQQENLSPQEKIDVLLAFGKKNFEGHQGELERSEGSGGQNGYEAEAIGLDKISEELGNPLVLNTAGLGFLWKVLGLDLKILLEQIKEDFSDKESVKELNLKAAEKGYDLGKVGDFRVVGDVGKKKEIANFTGNEALVKGIIAAECNFAAIYPMTPINSILASLAKTKIKLFRPEDEIAGIMAALGAAYAGDRAMVATSGGGFSLMIEGLGMAGIAEIPLVIILGQRTGPSTGMATYSSQADLNFAIYSGQGEFPRIVLTPGDLPELYQLSAEAFNLAETYQVPVILMTDKYLAESRFSIDERELKVPQVSSLPAGRQVPRVSRVEGYKRYQFTESGISPRAFPGQTAFLTNSYEHDEFGFSSDDSGNRKKMMEKREKKLERLSGGFEVYGPPLPRLRRVKEGRTVLVGWGSTKGILLDFIREHKEFDLVHFWRPWPFPKEAKQVLEKFEKVVVVEGNYSGQLADLIRKETGIKTEKILKDDGRPFFKEELINLINK